MTSAAPIIAVYGTMLLVIILAPDQPIPVKAPLPAVVKGVGLVMLWVTLLTTGLWDFAA